MNIDVQPLDPNGRGPVSISLQTESRTVIIRALVLHIMTNDEDPEKRLISRWPYFGAHCMPDPDKLPAVEPTKLALQFLFNGQDSF